MPAMLMFAYSFLAMTSYNILKPLTRSQFIATLGSENLPYVLFAAGILIGVVMHFYTSAIRRVPRQHVVPVTQAAIVGLLVVFWALLRTGAVWVPVAFYFFGLILGILLISQFWTLANDIFDARQAKRLFGFIGGGASLGGALGSGLTAAIVEEVGSEQLVLVSAAEPRRLRRHRGAGAARPPGRRAGRLRRLRPRRRRPRGRAPDRRVELAARARPDRRGAPPRARAVLDQQLSMAAEATQGDGGGDGIAAFLAEVTAYLSIAGFVVQVALISRIHRSVGIGVALLLLPIGFTTSAPGHPRHRGALGGGGGAGARFDPALHARQDHARDPLRAPAHRAAAPGQAVHRRHDGPVREGPDRGGPARAHPAVGPRPGLAAVELRQPRDHRPLDGGRGQGAARVHPGVPGQPRHPDHLARRGHDDRGRGRHRRGPWWRSSPIPTPRRCCTPSRC